MILYTGSTGAIGSQMPPGPLPLETRLERPAGEMEAELRAQGEGASFVHLAGMVNVEACEREPERAQKLNVEGSLRWFEAARRAGVAHFVFVSTAHVFAPPPRGERLAPDSPTLPRTVYARTKLLAELQLRRAAEQPASPRLTIARVFGVLSPAMPEGSLWATLHERARSRDLRPIRGLSCVRDYLEAGEICRRLVRLAETAAPPPIVLVCSGRGTTVRELAEQVFRAHGLDPAALREEPARFDEAKSLVGVPTPF